MEKIMNSYGRFERYYSELMGDIYPQPQPTIHDGHFLRAYRIIRRWIPQLKIRAVLDVGCGEGFCQCLFERFGVNNYLGLSLGEDVLIAKENHRSVVEMDFNFITLLDNSYDLVFARHALEHSLFPIITLMEWHRVSAKWLIVVTPRPLDGTIGFIGRNHYSVVESHTQLRWWLRRAGWMIRDKYHSKDEFRYLCEKKPRVSYEGWENEPLSTSIHDADKDDLVWN
jgi:SAM-dependent methyltransferase